MIITHKLNVDPSIKPVKWKKRKFAFERQRIIIGEIQKLKEAHLIQEVQYPTWVANLALVKKANGKWRMYVDFTDLNRAYPKDHYPLPSINKLINALAGYAICSLVDAISGYHQIIMDEPDDEKTTFITDERIFYYRVMPFGFKNTGATCQHLVNGLFK